MPTLPTSRRFVTQLLESLLLTTSDDANINPLGGVDETAKKQLLSLQVLFPNEFLPALDLLDRGLVTRFRIGHDAKHDAAIAEESTDADTLQPVQSETHSIDQDMLDTAETSTSIPAPQPLNTDQPIPDAHPQPPSSTNTIFYVRSAQQRSSRFSTSYDTTQSYEVRLLAWNCSCPAFAFAAFPSVQSEPPAPTVYQTDATIGQGEAVGWIFGGVSLGNAMPPVCKHLLACVLVERCGGLFGGFVEERKVSVEEAAGWAAGWGDS
ncbi:hypothetical protein CC86DRAFT_370200 [Ophiobolus disseminans]|uniref:SWIM-type domain-containing protein n=1 Tax=Ophiobolus disseminans TaxID=1469910 RepID=A0A6A6ZZZ7_9PLEO|nr:hypothetical protein CC86DRAFT_370200 [Ophiobolus disseminans]